MLSVLIIFFLLIPLNISIAENQKDDFGWEYSIQSGIAYSKRTYLLVYDPESQQKKEIKVISKCKKPYPAEGTYGECTHDINIKPTKTNIKLTSGEDVVLINNTFGRLILGTIAYGCCAGSDVIKFYTENGKYMGSLAAYDSLRIGKNVITDNINLKNSTESNNRVKYFIVQDDDDEYKYYAWIQEATGNMIKVPILFTLHNKKNCDEWLLSEFTKYSDRRNILMVFEGRFCEKQNRTFDCHRTKNNITCLPTN